MLETLPFSFSLFFVLVTIATLILFILVIKHASTENAREKSIPVLFILAAWLIIQAALALIHFYSERTDLIPPRLMLFGIIPPILVIFVLFLTRKGKAFIDSLPLQYITWINVVRIPVELGLLTLFMYKYLPVEMTFEGRNFDIFSGLTAPFIAYFGFAKKRFGTTIILIWNFICLALLLNILATALLSAPLPIQQLGFEQPNIAILHFPFTWLPVFIVPIVLFGHLVSIRRLITLKSSASEIY